jgi:two-component system, chemotaxis family, chemotaxis protein CheY
MKIVIAEDSQFMRSLLKDILTPKGYEVVEAANGREAIEKVQSEKPDLLLLDIIMPEMDGLEVLKKLKNSVPVVVISAVGQEKMVDEAKALGAAEYIIKPFEDKKVLEVVSKMLAA